MHVVCCGTHPPHANSNLEIINANRGHPRGILVLVPLHAQTRARKVVRAAVTTYCMYQYISKHIINANKNSNVNMYNFQLRVLRENALT